MAKVATVFGGSGFVGRYIVKRLAKEGWVVRVAVRDTEKAHFLQPYGNVGQIVRMPVPIQDEEAVREAVDGADAVFNAIGLLFEPGGAQTFDEVHVNGPERIARLSAETGVKRLIHVSAIGADSGSESVYARTKAEGEDAILKAFPQATILRPSIVIGPEDGFLNFFAQMARISPALPLIGGGKTRFQPVYVGDVADAAMTAVRESKTKGKTYELGGPKVYTFKQLMELMLKEIRRKRLLLPIPFGVAQMQGSQNNDPFVQHPDGRIGTSSNHHGGILGGISTGEEIIVRLAAKPPASIAQEQQTVDQQGTPTSIEIHGRHDPTVLPRLVPVAEAMLALVLADHLLRQRVARLNVGE